jgi:parvulin-like peptidyl-prolyl isomerase
MALNGIQTRNRRFAAGLAAALFLVLHSSQVQINAQKTRPLSTAELQKKYILTTLTQADIKLLLSEANPEVLKRFAADPELKKTQLKTLRELLAVGSAAVKSGIIDSLTARELENIRLEASATIFDQRLNKNTDKQPFSGITAARIKAFYARAGNEARFKRFLDDKIALARKDESVPAGITITEEERQEARDFFAKISISDAESKLKAKSLGAAYKRTVDLMVQLQRTQFLAKLYNTRVLAAKTKVTDEEIRAYIAVHPEFSSDKKKAKALGILARARAGEDFAALANEFSEDPGNDNPGGGKHGGLYADVQLGKMVKPFEQGALTLEPGKVGQSLVETDFGYHIIKLERKGESDDGTGNRVMTYDVRHILISTTIGDPENPYARPQPVTEVVRERLQAAKEKRVMDEILRNNPVSVAEDFDVSAN